MNNHIVPYSQLSNKDVIRVGGKNASLGEMMRNLTPLGIAVPEGFAITLAAYQDFLLFNKLTPLLQNALGQLQRSSLENLTEVAARCRELIMKSSLPQEVVQSIHDAYNQLNEQNGGPCAVAVRSSARLTGKYLLNFRLQPAIVPTINSEAYYSVNSSSRFGLFLVKVSFGISYTFKGK